MNCLKIHLSVSKLFCFLISGILMENFSRSVCILRTNRSLFPFDTNDVRQNLDCWQSKLLVSNFMWCTTYEDGHPMRDSTHMGTRNSPSSSLWICMDQPPKLHGTERTVTKTNAIVKSAENTSFGNSSSSSSSSSLSLNINPFSFNQIVVSFLFSHHVSCYNNPYFSLHCRYWFCPILNG